MKIEHEFNSCFTNIGKNLASKISNASTPFEYFVNKSDFVMETKPLSMNQLKEAFYSLKSNKSPGYGNNRLYKYLIENDILYSKQFGFQNGHSTDHAVLQAVDQIIESFKNNKYTLGVLTDLLKALDTVDHSILLKKLELYGITDSHRGWLKSYLSNRRQFVQINEKEKTSLETISCGVPQGSILGPLLFLLYVNDLKNASNILDPIMFADHTNLVFTHKDIRYLFQIVNQELGNINQ